MTAARTSGFWTLLAPIPCSELSGPCHQAREPRPSQNTGYFTARTGFWTRLPLQTMSVIQFGYPIFFLPSSMTPPRPCFHVSSLSKPKKSNDWGRKLALTATGRTTPTDPRCALSSAPLSPPLPTLVYSLSLLSLPLPFLLTNTNPVLFNIHLFLNVTILSPFPTLTTER